MNPVNTEYRAQRRESGEAVSSSERPVIASRPFVNNGSHEAVENARRLSVFRRRRHGVSDPRIEIWRFK